MAARPVPLASHQVSEVADVLARAFYDDPFYMFVLSEDDERSRLLRWFMEGGARFSLMFGAAYTTDEGVQGSAAWLTPGNMEFTPERMAKAGLTSLIERVGAAAFGRFMSLIGYLQPLHDRDVPPDHYHLMILGVDPARQGRGVGSDLIQPILARADVERRLCYLETAKEINLTFYRKHGFEVVVEDVFPNGGPRFWTMRREPARPKGSPGIRRRGGPSPSTGHGGT